MNAKLHPLIVVLVILLTFLAIGVWYWGTGEAKKIGGPAHIELGPNGHLYVQIQNQLLEHDAEGVFVARHDLSKLGVEHLLGGFAFFSDGDIVFRRGPDPRSLADNVRAFGRLPNRDSLEPEAAESGMYRCNLGTSTCRPFGTVAIDFKAAFAIYVDQETDEVFISDTTRHVVRKYSPEGEMLAEPVGGFMFPNKLLLHDERLFVVNTNNHQVRVIEPATETFGTELEAIDVVPGVAVEAGRAWPSHLARVGEEWWVIIMRTAMNEGGVYVFDDDWRFDRTVSLPANADPISLGPFQDVVLISDWDNDRIYRVSREGALLTDFASPGLEQVLAESRKLRSQYNIYSYLGILLFALVFGGLVVRSLIAGRSPSG